MKIDINIDVTPEELRSFFGLPEVKPLQEELLTRLRERIDAGSADFDPVRVMQAFVTPTSSAMEAMQKSFWQAFTTGKDEKSSE